MDEGKSMSDQEIEAAYKALQKRKAREEEERELAKFRPDGTKILAKCDTDELFEDLAESLYDGGQHHSEYVNLNKFDELRHIRRWLVEIGEYLDELEKRQ